MINPLFSVMKIVKHSRDLLIAMSSIKLLLKI